LDQAGLTWDSEKTSLHEGGDRSSKNWGAARGIVGRVETEIVWSGSPEKARALLAAVSPDDPDSFEAEIIEVGENAELRIIVVGEQLKTVRSTVDDLLACLAAAETSLDISE
tara:strand:+ start:194 stop:529 length:336 start_codon:yes stop_codon:yes gene_type:complete